MQSRTQHFISKILCSTWMLYVSQQTVGSIYSNTPFIQALLVDGPQFRSHTGHGWWPWSLESFKTLDRQLPFH